MGASKELFLKLTEQEYMAIPADVRERHLSHKVYSESVHDFQDLIKDELYSDLYKKKKEISEQLNERQYQLREINRKNGNNRNY